MPSFDIIGAGAIGCFVAAKFSSAGFDTSLVARGARKDALQRDGLTIHSGSTTQHLYLNVISGIRRAPRPDFVVICVKTPDLGDVLEELNCYEGNMPVLVTVQNGVEAPQLVSERFPRAIVIASRVHGFFELVGAALHHVGVQPSIHFGAWAQPNVMVEAALLDALVTAGIRGVVSTDIEAELWEKLMLASSIGSVGAAFKRGIGQISQDPTFRSLLEIVMLEVAAVATARGIKLEADVVKRLLTLVDGFPAEATSSMHRDLENRRPSEFDQLSGAIMRMGKIAGLALPAHDMIFERLVQTGLLGEVS